MPELRTVGSGLVKRDAMSEVKRLREAGKGAWLKPVAGNRFDVVTDAAEVKTVVRAGAYDISLAAPSWSTHGGQYRTKGAASVAKGGRKPNPEKQAWWAEKRAENELKKAEHARKHGFGQKSRIASEDRVPREVESENWWDNV